MGKETISMSATRMSTYLQCRWKYWCNYILHKPKLSNISFKLGIAVHETLKFAGEIWKEKEKFTAYDIKKIKNVYRKVAAREGIENMAVYDEGLQMVLNKLDNFEVGKIIGVESRFEVATDDGVTIIGAIDKIIELDEDTILIVDYKTSKFFYTHDEMKNDIQLSIYNIVANIMFPRYKRIVLCLDYLRNEPSYTYRTYQERKAFSKYVLAIYNEILSLEEKDAKPSLNDMCSWCDFREDCPAYIKATKNSKVFKKKLESFDNNELVEEYLDIRSRKKILDNHEKKLKFYIIEKIRNDETNLVGKNNEIYIRQNPSMVYNPKTVYGTVPLKDFLGMISVSKRLLDEYLEGDQVNKSKIVETATKNYTNPFLSIKKKRLV